MVARDPRGGTRQQRACSGTWLKRASRVGFVLLSIAAFTPGTEGAGEPGDLLPLVRAHAHNDYEHARPLLDALDQGFCSVEADVHLVDGQLLVAHDRAAVTPERSLEALYLEPLRRRAELHAGRIFPNGPPTVYLLIDFKTAADPTYAALREVLRPYRALLTEFRADAIRTNAVTIIVSGNRPRETVGAEAVRWVAIDGRLPDLQVRPPVTLVPWVSDNWQNHFRWNGEGPFPAGDRERLTAMVRAAHGQGRLLRLWATPDRPAAWQVLLDAGVDLINTDNLAGLAGYLRGGDTRGEPGP